MAQNRYYSNLARGTYLANPGGISNSQTQLQTASTQDWPTSFPFAIRLEPGALNEEVVLATSGAGTSVNPFIVTRGYDGTPASAHGNSVPIIPGVIQLDLAEPQQHLNLSGAESGAHGLPPSAWTGGAMTLIDTISVGTAQPTLPFTGIPNTYNNLRIEVVGRSSYASGSEDDLTMTINGVSSDTYGDVYFFYLAGGTLTPQTHQSSPYTRCGCMWAEGTATGNGRAIINIPGYSLATWIKGWDFQSFSGDGITAGTGFLMWGGGSCEGVTGAISSITLGLLSGDDFMPNTTAYLYAY